MTMSKFDVRVEIDDRRLHDTLVSAIEGGCNYWASVDVGRHEPDWANYFTAKLTIIEESDESNGAIQGRTYQLSLDKLRSGVTTMANKYPHHFKDVMMGDGDATTGDVLVQCALFGTIVYG
jgi:hypothetical protein